MTLTRIRAQWERHDERFAAVNGDEHVRVLYDEGSWLEGPAYSPAWRTLLFSDIPDDRVLALDEATGRIGVWRSPGGYANGRTIDRAGRMIQCEQGNRAVTRTEPDGTVTVLADRWQGKRFNSPNDVVEHSDGTVWFTDPPYGILNDYEGHRATPEIDGCHVYRIDPDGSVTRVADDFERPNGLAFSADERTLYLVDTHHRHLRRFDVGADLSLSGGEVLGTSDAGGYDGVRVDDGGRLWVAAHDGLHCWHPDGTLLGKLLLPEVCSNLTFGGPKRNVLYVTATNMLLSVRVTVAGIR
ncbi:SMP-30/gluconolactonase/LRE family protein [Promicromonospora iranensis]|uniref:Gluconolactonase n=1 Tax=Promicromonospora iranensis TaxID=1105144 RepID=A0ABU2CJX9_9MICO|nr:SMP-30/gluconolactonase/LRE family protein [Promicromonospora iranensis]MDR7381644.1 gluconolactonase [Promicromonospora iranensis]